MTIIPPRPPLPPPSPAPPGVGQVSEASTAALGRTAPGHRFPADVLVGLPGIFRSADHAKDGATTC
jgi:hypothetical protein